MSGSGVNDAIETMPGISRQSVDVLMETIAGDMDNGISVSYTHLTLPTNREV